MHRRRGLAPLQRGSGAAADALTGPRSLHRVAPAPCCRRWSTRRRKKTAQKAARRRAATRPGQLGPCRSARKDSCPAKGRRPPPWRPVRVWTPLRCATPACGAGTRCSAALRFLASRACRLATQPRSASTLAELPGIRVARSSGVAARLPRGDRAGAGCQALGASGCAPGAACECKSVQPGRHKHAFSAAASPRVYAVRRNGRQRCSGCSVLRCCLPAASRSVARSDRPPGCKLTRSLAAQERR